MVTDIALINAQEKQIIINGDVNLNLGSRSIQKPLERRLPMQPKDNQFTAATFVDEVDKRLNIGKGALAWLINAYHWAGREGHITEIHRYAPNFTMDWLRSRIMAIFNINPSDLERAISRLGGDNPKFSEKVCEVVNRVGISAVCRADSMLTPEQKKTFMAEIPEATEITPETFREEVQKRYNDGLKKMGPAVVKESLRTGIKHDLRLENIALRKDVAILRKENATLRKENDILRNDNKILLQKVDRINVVMQTGGNIRTSQRK